MGCTPGDGVLIFAMIEQMMMKLMKTVLIDVVSFGSSVPAEKLNTLASLFSPMILPVSVMTRVPPGSRSPSDHMSLPESVSGVALTNLNPGG